MADITAVAAGSAASGAAALYIAQALGISAHTVRNHLKNLYRRAGVHSQQELLLAMKPDQH